ncbi:MAG: 3'-5' exonuclease [Nitrospirota bacterium]
MVNELLALLKKDNHKAPVVDTGMAIREASYVAVDTELTGLNEKKDSIVSIGAVRIKDGKLNLGDTFYRLVSPETKLRKESVVIHGIMPSELDKEPSIDEVIYEFVKFCGDDVIIGHCLSIDLAFMNKELKRIIGYSLKNPAVDTFAIHEWLIERLPSYRELFRAQKQLGLYQIAKSFGIPSGGAHNAEMDAYVTAQIFQRFVPMLAGAGIERMGDLLKLGNPYKGGGDFKLSCGISNF